MLDGRCAARSPRPRRAASTRHLTLARFQTGAARLYRHTHTHTATHTATHIGTLIHNHTRRRISLPPRRGLGSTVHRALVTASHENVRASGPPRLLAVPSPPRLCASTRGGDRATSCARWARLVASRYRWQPDELPQLGRAAPTRAPDVTAGRSAAQPSDCRAHGPHPPGARTASGAGGLRLRSQPSRLASRSRMGGRRAGEREGAGMPRRHPAARMDTTRAAL